MILPALDFKALAQRRRQARPRMIVLIKVFTEDGREAVFLDIPNFIPTADNEQEQA